MRGAFSVRRQAMGATKWLVCLACVLGSPAWAQRPKGNLASEISALGGADVEAAARAADTLGASTNPAAHDALLDALALGLPAAVTPNAFVALAKHPAPPDVAALRRYANHHTPGVRSAALGALALYPAADAKAAVAAGLSDNVASVRAAAAAAAAKGRVRSAIEPLLKLLARGEEPAARALAAMADAELVRKLGDQLGKVPEASLALALGEILVRTDFGPDPERVEIVRAIAKINDSAAVTVLQAYLDKTPKNPPRPSRQEAQGVVDARLGGEKQK